MNSDKARAAEAESADRRFAKVVGLDGNVAAGILSEVFVSDSTTIRAVCANCGTKRWLGALLVYGERLGGVMRCPTCDAVVLRFARTPRQLCLDPTGSKLLLMPDVTSPPVARAGAS
jgi:hypothetical protein